MNGKPLYLSLLILLLGAGGSLWYALNRQPWTSVTLYWLAGFTAFTLVEYLFHRYVFHMVTDTITRKKLQYAVHGNHHAAPSDMTGVMMKPSLAVCVLLILSPLFYFLFGPKSFALLPGFLCGYACYLFIHFAVHAYRPPHNVLRWLWRLHHLHHHHNDHKNFGVSSPLWDIIFGTYQPAKTKKRGHAG